MVSKSTVGVFQSVEAILTALSAEYVKVAQASLKSEEEGTVLYFVSNA